MTPTLLNNRYRVSQALGAGGFGNTFLAEDTHMPSRRRCVIKQLKPVTHDPQTYQLVQQRFQREAAVLEELGEGNNQIPKLYAYFSEAGQFYLVQEWIEGDTLTKKVEQGDRLGDTEVKQILVSLLPVLDYVHSRHMVHRDIKPDNIIIRKRDGLPVLIDFGAVKEAMNTVVNEPGNSAPSMVIGTPGFMSSEQAGGRPTYSSDLYSLGLSAVFLLTGKMPQELETDARTGEFLWRQYAGNINSNLAMVIDRAIRFNPRDRFASAKEMLDALQSGQSGDAISEMATVAVSPGGLLPARNNLTPPIANSSPPQTIPVGANPVIRSNNDRKPWIIGALLAGGVLLTAVAIAVGLKRSPEPLSSSEQSTTQQPSSPTSLGSRSQPANSEPPLEKSTTQQPSSTIPSRSQPSAITPSPIPAQSPSVRSPQSPTLGSNNPTPSLGKSIPGFAPGTQRQAVEVELGSPTKVSKGVWPNTRAVLYEEFVPNQVSLGYLFDRNSGRLRQTEVSFAQSIELKTMSQTLEKMLNGNASADIKQGLQAVYQGKSNRYTFASGRENSLKGVIERNERDRIYMAVWEADLH